jgi:hypothetical protein
LQSLQRAVATARVMVQQQHGVVDDTKNIVHEKLLDRIEALCGDFQSQSHTEVAWRAMADEHARTIDRLVLHRLGGASSPELPHSTTTTTSPHSGTNSSSSGDTKNGHFSWERVQSLQRVLVAARSKNHDKDHDTDGNDTTTITTEELCAVAESLCKVYETQCRTVAVLQTVCHERGQTLDRLFRLLAGNTAAAQPGLPPLMPLMRSTTTANGNSDQTMLWPSLRCSRQRADTPIPLFGIGGDF